jgi:hypothetical protein
MNSSTFNIYQDMGLMYAEYTLSNIFRSNSTEVWEQFTMTKQFQISFLEGKSQTV